MVLYVKILELLLIAHQASYSSNGLFAAQLSSPQLISIEQVNADNTYHHDRSQLSSLRQVLFVHRHGDRTPISFMASDPLKSDPLWKLHGSGELTHEGKARLYLLGREIRDRYEEFLQGSVNKNERLTFSSAKPRCIESAQLFLAGFLRLNLANSTDGEQLVWDTLHELAHIWQPANIISVPLSIDGMLHSSAECRSYDKEMDGIEKSQEAYNLLMQYEDEIFKLRSHYGMEVNSIGQLTSLIDTIGIEKIYMESRLPREILNINDRLQVACDRMFGFSQSTLKVRRLRAGLLINDIIRHMEIMRANGGGNSSNTSSEKTKRFVQYSTHDMTITPLLGILQAWQSDTIRPGFASNLAFELHEDEKRSEWFVQIFYMQQFPGPKPIEIHLSECEKSHQLGRCTLEAFHKIMEPNLIGSWQDWMRECNNDLTKINLYR